MTLPDPDHGEFVAPPPWQLPSNIDGPMFPAIREAQQRLANIPTSETPPGHFTGRR